jgi:ribonuclease HII
MLEDCSALLIIHVNENGDMKYHRAGNLTTLVGAASIFGKALRDETAEGFDDWNPD